CIGTYWYQCYREGDWWGMSHAEPFLLRTFYGDPDKLVEAVERVQKGEVVEVTCLADGNKEQLHLRKGKVQRLKASLSRQDYNPKGDFAGWGGDGGEQINYKTTTLLAAGSDWRYVPAKEVAAVGERWRIPDFDDSKWRLGKTPIGYGEDEIKKRGGT